MAAAYTVGIVRNHPFVDGNKRTAFVVGVLFLELNGHRFTATEEDATQAVLGLAAGAIDEASFTRWLRANVGRSPRWVIGTRFWGIRAKDERMFECVSLHGFIFQLWGFANSRIRTAEFLTQPHKGNWIIETYGAGDAESPKISLEMAAFGR
jgi:Fic/DOC family